MKIQYCSDLHLEFPMNKKHLKANPIKPEGEILLLADDIVQLLKLKKNTTSSISFPTVLNTRTGFPAIMNIIVQTAWNGEVDGSNVKDGN